MSKVFAKNKFRDIQSSAISRLAQYFVFVALILSVFSATIPSHAQTALETTTEVQTNNGYGRLIITLPELTKFIGHRVSTDDSVLVVRLDEAVEIDLTGSATELLDYIRIARQDPDRDVLRFALNSGIRVNTIAAGEHLFIDFLPANWTGELPSIPESIVRKLEQRAEDAIEIAEQNAFEAAERGEKATLSVRLGRHPTFSRFVFGWNIPFNTSFKREKNKVSVTFDKVGETEFAKLRSNLPPLVSGISAKKLTKSTVITITVANEAKVRSYFDNKEYVVDITSDDLAKTAEGGTSLPFLIGGLPPVPSTSTSIADIQAQSGDRELAALPAPSEEELIRRLEQQAEIIDGSGSPEGEKTNQKDRRDSKAPKEEDAPEFNVESVPDETRKFPGLSSVRAAINDSGDAVRITYPFETKTPAAVFRRSKAIWMVFKTEDIIDISALRALIGDFIRKVDIHEYEGYKAIRLALPSVQLASSAIDENNWIISIGSTVIKASETLNVERNVNDNGGLFLRIPMEQPRGKLIFADPVVGDKLHVIVADPPTRGLVRQQSFVDLQVLPSTHSVAFTSLSDGLNIELSESGVAITSGNGLSLSPTKNLRASIEGGFTNDDWYDLGFESAALKIFDTARIPRQEQKLVNELLAASDAAKPRHRVELAQFYAANGFASEALASLQRAVESDPTLENKSSVVFTKAAAEIDLGRYDDALATLSPERFAKSQEAAVWRTIAANHKLDFELASNNAALGRLALGSLDSETKQSFFLAASDASLMINDLNGAKNYLSNIILDSAEDYHRGRYEILQGELAEAEERNEDARFFLNSALENEDWRIAADAKLARIKLDKKTGSLSNQQAINELENFVATWRKDHIELEALRELGGVLAEEKQYRRAFELVEEAIISDQNSPITYAIQDDMRDVFLNLFHKGDADDLSPVESLSLYYDFRNLMPIDRVGDEIVRYLASRLIDLDLLPQAAELLSHQVDERLKGAARARVAADLAVVQLLDSKPHRALTTLRKSQTANIPAALRRQRTMIEGFAISQTGNPDIALELLAPLAGADVERLRANINWDSRRWLEAGRILERIHSGRWSEESPLETRARLDVLRAAIAFSLAEDDFALNRLNQKFGQKMSESIDGPTFQILVRPLEDEGFERDVTVDNILNIDSHDTFLEDYRRRYFGRSRNPQEV